MLGKEVFEMLKKQLQPVVSSDREVDIRSPKAINEFADKHKPTWIINCSAYTAVDNAEDDIDLAYKLNKEGAGNIARLANDMDIPLIHISTDYVFDGSSPKPLREEAPVGPLTVYGKSKLAGEEEIRKICPQHFIIRTAWLYGEYGNNFVSTMLTLMDDQETLNVVDDQIGSPTWTLDLVKFIIYLIFEESSSYGTYHFSGEGYCSWFEFANEIYKEGIEQGLLSNLCKIDSCSSDIFPTKAKRPAYSLLSKEKITTVFKYRAPHWENSLHIYLKGKIT